MRLTIPIGIGEAFDRLTILQIKSELITDEEKLKNIYSEYAALHGAMVEKDPDYQSHKNYIELYRINRQLWDIENNMRRYEQKQYFGIDFVQTARKVYKKNDVRAKIKRVINRHYNSDFVEEKSHSTVNE